MSTATAETRANSLKKLAEICDGTGRYHRSVSASVREAARDVKRIDDLPRHERGPEADRHMKRILMAGGSKLVANATRRLLLGI